jgi:hypothetical protein
MLRVLRGLAALLGPHPANAIEHLPCMGMLITATTVASCPGPPFPDLVRRAGGYALLESHVAKVFDPVRIPAAMLIAFDVLRLLPCASRSRVRARLLL